MSYANTANKPNPAAMLGALSVPAAVGAVLVIGLAVKVAIPDQIENPDVFDVRPDEPELPPPPPEPTQDQATETPVVTPTYQAPVESPFDFEFDPGSTAPIETLPDFTSGTIGPVEIPGSGVGTTPALPDPISASPRGNPGRWVTDNDYRSNWIRRGMSGVAGFALSIDKKGRVSDCQITRSTGHDQLDAATCKLIESRARFEAAKDRYGNPVAGSYSNSVNWKLPE